MKIKSILLLAQIISPVVMSVFFISLCHSEIVSFTIGNASGYPGSVNNQVSISMNNPTDNVKAIILQIC